jgi:hypothetical protein
MTSSPRATGDSSPLWRRVRLFLSAGLLCALVSAAPAHGAFRLIGLSIEDAATREVVEGHSLARQLPPVRFPGTLRATEWLLERPAFAATLARHLHPPLERYHLTDKGNGRYEVDDLGALRGELRLVARGLDRRVYLCEGEFRSLAHLLKLSGTMVFTLEYREITQDNGPYIEVTPQLFVRLNNILAHGMLKVLAPLLDGVIDRRVGNLTTATQIVSQRLISDPGGLYREIQTWPEVRPEELEAYRLAFSIGGG